VGSPPTDLRSLRDLIPFAAELGIELLEATPEIVRARLEWAPERTTAANLLHGGVMHRGRTLAVLETEVTRDDGKLAAKVTQTQIYHHASAAQ
jgi:acyl-coenzyme A thioesterase PaaI-like protein